jgi:glycosyltransferase involved in cell wall biosynthesis
MPRVSVIIPSFNHDKYIAETIGSVLRQTYQDFEIVITDDGSTDNTVEVVKSFHDPRIRWFAFPKNRGACIAANHCVEQSRGEYIAMLSSDDIFIEEKLEKQVAFLDEHPEYGVVLSRAQIIDEDGQDFLQEDHFYTKVFIQPNRNRWAWLNHFFYQGNCLCHPSALIRRECYQTIGLYDPRFAQLPDFDFWIRICSQYEIYILAENLLKFRIRQNEANASSSRLDARVRAGLEFKQILSNYLAPGIARNFTKIFFDRVDKITESSPEVVPFFLAQTALQAGTASHKAFAIDTLYRLFQEESAPRSIEGLDFDFRDLIRLTGQQDIFNLVSVETVQELHVELSRTQRDYQARDTELEAARKVILQMLDKIAGMESSKFWKARKAWFKLKRLLGLAE